MNFQILLTNIEGRRKDVEGRTSDLVNKNIFFILFSQTIRWYFGLSIVRYIIVFVLYRQCFHVIYNFYVMRYINI